MGRNFTTELSEIFARNLDLPKSEPMYRFIEKPTAKLSYNIVKLIEDRASVVEYGVSLDDALQALKGRFKDTVKAGLEVKYQIVPQI